ncbi:MAG: hypothetical protein QOF48_1391 [Verrucomicrobiota bacterium]
MKGAALFAFLVFCPGGISSAAVPGFDGFFPAGAARGTTNSVVATGKSDVWPARIWVDSPGLEFTAETNKGVFSVRAAADARPGPRLVRLYADDGPGDFHFFVIGEGSEILEIEPNNHFKKPQPIGKLPVTINGRLDKNGDVDSFAIALAAGQWLDARVDSYTLMSKVDAVLRLVSTNGEQLAWNHDFITLDPRLSWHATQDEQVMLQIFGFAYPPGSEIGFTGGESAVYRLHIMTTNGEPRCGNAVERPLVEGTPDAVQPVTLPAVVQGSIGTMGHENRYSIELKKNDIMEIRVDAASLGSPLDAWVKIEETTGKTVATTDDVDGSRDPRLEWKAPSNGTFNVAVGSVTHRGGAEFCYRLSIQKAGPDFSAALSSSAFDVVRGQTNELKFNLKRLRGFTNGLAAVFTGLPDSITALTTNLSSGDGTISIGLAASPDAPRFQGPVHLELMDSVTHERRAVPFDLTTRGETGFNHLLVDSTDIFWLTVLPKPVEASKPKSKKK